MPCSACEWKADFRTLSVANIVTGDGGKKLILRLAFTSIELSLSLSFDCRRYCSLVKTWRYISQGWTLHRIKAGRQQTNCLWQRMLYCLLDLMDRQFLPRYLWMMRLEIPHCDTTCTFHASRYTPTCRDIRSHETPSRARHWRYLLLSLSLTHTHTHMYARAC